eukprot:2498495-Pleurochrysis_carterae.AAC.2
MVGITYSLPSWYGSEFSAPHDDEGGPMIRLLHHLSYDIMRQAYILMLFGCSVALAWYLLTMDYNTHLWPPTVPDPAATWPSPFVRMCDVPFDTIARPQSFFLMMAIRTPSPSCSCVCWDIPPVLSRCLLLHYNRRGGAV